MNRLLHLNRRITLQTLAYFQRLPHPVRQFYKGVDEALINQTCTLPDGRTLGFAEFGAPRGTPAFFFHGAPGSRYDGVEYDEIAKRFDIRIICPDRSGHGLSTLIPGFKLLDYPRDVSNLAKHLGVGRYYVFGQSGGGPYSIACAHMLPQRELLGAGVVAGMGHASQVNVREAGWYTTVVLGMYKWFPGFTRAMMAYSWRPSKLQDDEKMAKTLRTAFKYLRSHDRKEMEEPQVMPVLLATMRQAFAQGPDGALSDVDVFANDWGFELGDVQGKVKLFYGLDDDRTPPVFGRYLKDKLKDAELTEFEGATHFSIHRHQDEIFAKMFGREAPTPRRSGNEPESELKGDGKAASG